ncbi:MAG: Hsp20/alpha crystallin family protein [Actinobacteria bacterium]|nr:Hsp20/alpha crystallin family protein [Actinomycetota bacterium]
MAEKDKKKENDKEDESVAGGILKGIGKMIPGLGGLFKGLEKSPAFKERLKKIDEEVERKLKETPLKRAEGRPSGIPSGIPTGVRGRTFREKSFIKRETEVKPSPPPAPQERPVDIFDEKDHIKIIAEMPGIDEDDINLNLQEDKLTISVDIPKRKYHQELKLPCAPKGKIEKVYRNGILEIKITKKPETSDQ